MSINKISLGRRRGGLKLPKLIHCYSWIAPYYVLYIFSLDPIKLRETSFTFSFTKICILWVRNYEYFAILLYFALYDEHASPEPTFPPSFKSYNLILKVEWIIARVVNMELKLYADLIVNRMSNISTWWYLHSFKLYSKYKLWS